MSGAPAKVRWDRLGRLALLSVVAVLIYLYAGAATRLLSTLHQSHSDHAAVAALEREHAVLTREHQSLKLNRTVEAEARQLGMMKKDEQQYIVSGLPKD